MKHCPARALAEKLNGNDAARENDKRGEGELPIDVYQHHESEDDCDWMLENITAHLGQRHLHRASIVHDSRHQHTGAHPIKKIHRLIYDLAEELIANVCDSAVTHPIHVIGVAVTRETTGGHDRRNQEANEEN